MAVATSTLLLFAIMVPSLIVYIMFLNGLNRLRHKHPFNSPFFKLIFSIGVIDIIRLIEDWFLFKFSLLGWFWMDKVVMMMPKFISKVHSMFSWYFAHAQVFGTLVLAVNRLSICAFMKDWKTKELHISLILLWGLPLLTNIPLWPMDFHFSSNGANGTVFLYWANTDWQWYYLTFCAFLCSSTAVLCAICYGAIFIKVRQRRLKLKANPKMKKVENKKNNEELKLVLLGVVLTVLAGFCGAVCGAMAYGISPKALDVILPYFNLVNDMWCWINPYLLLICSTPVKQHMKVFFCCCKNSISPGARTNPSNKRASKATSVI